VDVKQVLSVVVVVAVVQRQMTQERQGQAALPGMVAVAEPGLLMTLERQKQVETRLEEQVLAEVAVAAVAAVVPL